MSKDEIWKRDEPQSPCVKVCIVQPETRLCVGCLRSIEEISAWSRLSPEARAEIMSDLPGRSERLTARRGGRRGRLGQNGRTG